MKRKPQQSKAYRKKHALKAKYRQGASVIPDYEGLPAGVVFEESKHDIPRQGKRREYAGKDNLTADQGEYSPSGPGSDSDAAQSPQDEGYTAHAEERPDDEEELPKDKELSEIDENIGIPGKKHKPECRGDAPCIKKHPDSPWGR